MKKSILPKFWRPKRHRKQHPSLRVTGQLHCYCPPRYGVRRPDANTVAQDAEIRILREKLEANSKREQEENASRERDKRAELDRLEGLVREARRDADGLRSQMAFKDQARPHHNPFPSSLASFLLCLLSSS